MRKAGAIGAVMAVAWAAPGAAEVFGGTFRDMAGVARLHASVEPGEGGRARYCFPGGTGDVTCVDWTGVDGSWERMTSFAGAVGLWTFTRTGEGYEVLFVSNDGGRFTADFVAGVTVEALLRGE